MYTAATTYWLLVAGVILPVWSLVNNTRYNILRGVCIVQSHVPGTDMLALPEQSRSQIYFTSIKKKVDQVLSRT